LIPVGDLAKRREGKRGDNLCFMVIERPQSQVVSSVRHDSDTTLMSRAGLDHTLLAGPNL